MLGHQFVVANYMQKIMSQDWHPMHLLSIRQWKQIFSDAGFMVKSERICIPDDDLKWRRTAGTLFLTGTRE